MSMQVQRESQPRNESIFEGQKKGIWVRLSFFLSLLLSLLFLSNFAFGQAITSFTPTSGPIGSTVTITGTDFTDATAVTFNGTAATSFTVNSATSITATVPTGATSGTITVTTPSGTATSGSSYLVRSIIVESIPTTLSTCVNSIGTSASIVISGQNLSGGTIVLQVKNEAKTGTQLPFEFSKDGTNFSDNTTFLMSDFGSNWSNPNLASSTIYIRAKAQSALSTTNYQISVSGAGTAAVVFFPIQRIVNDLPFVLTSTAAPNVFYCNGATASALNATATAGHTLQWYTVTPWK